MLLGDPLPERSRYRIYIMTTATISAVGDLSLSGDFIKDFDGKLISDEVQSFLQSDIVIGNLECIVSPEGKKYDPDNLLLHSDERILSILQGVGFNVFSMANNHIYDAREEGLLFTIECLDLLGIKHCGAGKDISEAIAPAIFEIADMTIGIFSSISTQYFVGDNNIASQSRSGLAPLNQGTIDKIIEQYEGQLDYKIMCVHWGLQDIPCPSDYEIHMSKELINNGFNLILGHHPHVIQGVGEHSGSHIAFSMGNFYFHPIFHAGELFYGNDRKYRKNKRSIILRGDISNYNNRITHQYSIIPTFQNSKNIVNISKNILYFSYIKYLNFVAFSPFVSLIFKLTYFWDLNKKILLNIPIQIRKKGMSHYFSSDIFTRIFKSVKSVKSVSEDLKRLEDN